MVEKKYGRVKSKEGRKTDQIKRLKMKESKEERKKDRRRTERQEENERKKCSNLLYIRKQILKPLGKERIKQKKLLTNQVQKSGKKGVRADQSEEERIRRDCIF